MAQRATEIIRKTRETRGEDATWITGLESELMRKAAALAPAEPKSRG